MEQPEIKARPKTLAELVAAHPMLQDVACGVSVDDGWVPLLDRLCSLIEARAEHAAENHARPDDWPGNKDWYGDPFTPVVAQVKEKFGGLRFYVDEPTNNRYVDGLVAMAESMSFSICEACGNAGQLRRKGWWKTRCDACEAANQERMNRERKEDAR